MSMKLKKYPLWPGLSMDVRIDTHDESGTMIIGCSPEKNHKKSQPEDLFVEIEPMIRDIIESNIVVPLDP